MGYNTGGLCSTGQCCNEIHNVVIPHTLDPTSIPTKLLTCPLLLSQATKMHAGYSGVQLSVGVESLQACMEIELQLLVLGGAVQKSLCSPMLSFTIGKFTQRSLDI